ncbi:MAG: hypothetical protein U0800_16730 [Isosphaeraceae bacterium]
MSPDRTLVLIRERSTLELLDLGLLVIRRRPLTLVLWLAAGVWPFVLFNTWLVGRLDPEADLPPAYILGLLVGLEAPWATAPLTIVLGGLMFGERPRVGSVLRTLIRSLPPMLLYQGLARAALLGCCFPILTPLIFGKQPFFNEVILLERGRWGAILSRCGDLSRDRGIVLLGRAILAVAASLLFIAAFSYGMGNLTDLLLRQDEPLWVEPDLFVDPTTWTIQLGTWLAVGYCGVVRFLSYIDQRIRLEGWELELRMKALRASMEDDDRW